MARKKKHSGFGMDGEYHMPSKHHKGDGAHMGVSAHHAHPHRGPHGMKDGAKHYNQDRAQDEPNEHLTLDGHTFGMDADYDGPGPSHHLGNNCCHED
jgi:hypothetical protein